MDIESLQAAGWKCHQANGFTGHLGPLWVRRTDEGRVVGMIVADYHCNNHLGSIHGGALMTLADIGLGHGVADVLGGYGCVTVSLQTQFVAGARLGDFVVCHSEVIRRSKHLVFVRGLITVGETTVASAEGIWKVLEPRSGKFQ
jgi:uncharacterized protein (TIGR00369 family)